MEKYLSVRESIMIPIPKEMPIALLLVGGISLL
jgi:hypothetical protein